MVRIRVQWRRRHKSVRGMQASDCAMGRGPKGPLGVLLIQPNTPAVEHTIEDPR